MGFAEAIAALGMGGVGIALVCVIGTSVHRWIAYKQRQAELDAEANRARLASRDDYTETLEERVRVLERIATDRGHDIAHQIENLRDRQAVEKL